MREITPKIIGEDIPSMSSTGRKVYPHFGIDMEHLPESKKWDLKKKYRIVLEVEMTGKSINERREDQEEGYADFDITGIEVVNQKKKEFKVLYKE